MLQVPVDGGNRWGVQWLCLLGGQNKGFWETINLLPKVCLCYGQGLFLIGLTPGELT